MTTLCLKIYEEFKWKPAIEIDFINFFLSKQIQIFNALPCYKIEEIAGGFFVHNFSYLQKCTGILSWN